MASALTDARTAGDFPMALADLLRRALVRLALVFLRMLAPRGIDTGMTAGVAVALPDLRR